MKKLKITQKQWQEAKAKYWTEGKPLSTILREQKVNEKLAMTGTRTNTPTKRSKTHEHKPDNNIRLQITIDCRIL